MNNELLYNLTINNTIKYMQNDTQIINVDKAIRNFSGQFYMKNLAFLILATITPLIIHYCRYYFYVAEPKFIHPQKKYINFVIHLIEDFCFSYVAMFGGYLIWNMIFIKP